MKAVFIALILCAAVAAASMNSGMHVQMKNSNPRMEGLINKMVQSYVNSNNEQEIHVDMDLLSLFTDEELEAWGFFDKIKDVANTVGNGIKDAANTVKNEVKDAANAAGNGIKDAANTVGNEIKDIANTIANVVGGGVVDISNDIKNGVVDVTKIVGKGVVDVSKIVGDGVVTAAVETGDFFKKGFDVTKDGIDVAIRETEGAFNKVKNEISSIKLPKIEIGDLIEPIIEFAKFLPKMIPCALALKAAAPQFIQFAKAAAANDAASAVVALMQTLQHLPKITEECIGKPFSIPKGTMDKIRCAADIIALTAIIVQFIVVPENVVGNLNGLKSMVFLIPTTIEDCTGAFSG